MSPGPPRRGRVVAVHGHHFQVHDGEHVIGCVTRGKKGGVACGDWVRFASTHACSGVIERIEPRRNLLYRSDRHRSKLIAANLDQALVVVAAVPLFREELLIRCLLACEAADIPARIILNKTDLAETADLAEALRAYATLGYTLTAVSALGDIAALQALLRGRTSVLVGASGTGKSSLLNRLVPTARATVGEISQVLDAGRHTTTHTRLHALPGGQASGSLIDSPGMQEFGLEHLRTRDLMHAFPEIRGRLGLCRFHDCRHVREPGCAVLEAAQAGGILPSRLRVYHSLLQDR
ncbi:MAG TPA: ribosome small subunit-dependent GTPase A [Thiobacillaceae bacterium]|nr:ribosome small subunit-dependent GTPase A [Thiobacillaceae bacterium]HNU63130.1 ribosome small subunit-dependent GTPase A [Thiobacillaceae bacterium]